jgi:beta-1,4-mannosyl-glycoprotein beta-1,4-N-acetylglucosaminyltransferase
MPEPAQIYKMCQRGCVRLSQQMFYYNLNYHFKERWTAPFFITVRLLHMTRSIQFFRYESAEKTSVTIECGWHFSYFQSAEEIARKLSSFCHSEYNTEKYKDKSHINHCIKNGIDLFERGNKKLHKSTCEEIEVIPEAITELSRELCEKV